ncbi:MAG: hypothetical protein V8K32_07870 [Candidatus Electrothrix gigas]
MKKLPIGRQEFKGLIEDNCIYVDSDLFSAADSSCQKKALHLIDKSELSGC